MTANICMALETSASTESNRQDMNIPVVKGTAHTGLKKTRAKIMIITFAGFDVGCCKSYLKKIRDIPPFIHLSLEMDFSYLEGIVV